MLILLCLSYGISLWMLIKTADHSTSSRRFWIKIFTCMHPLLILLLGILQDRIQFIDIRLVIALAFAFLGDVFLGLKHRFKKAMLLGILAFTLTHVTLIAMFFKYESSLWLLLFVSLLWITLYTAFARNLKLGSYTKIIAVYTFLILLMLGFASSRLFFEPTTIHFVQWLAALSFISSDRLLAIKYFSEKLPAWVNPSYLILYHLALSLFTLSLFL